MEDPNVIRTETRLRLPIFGQLPDVGHRKLAMCLNLGECQIANALVDDDAFHLVERAIGEMVGSDRIPPERLHANLCRR